MFGTLDLASLLTDAQSIVTLFATPIAIIVAFWGSRKLVGILRKFVR